LCDVLACVFSDTGTGNRFGDTGAQSLAEGLKVNRTLTTLSLSCMFIQHNSRQLCDVLVCVMSDWGSANSIGEAGALALAEALKTNLSLTTLDLSCMFIQHNLAQLCNISACVISDTGTGNRFGDDGAQSLAEGLKENRTLTALSLSCMFIQHNP
jgi:Ran GTPase-activating protein (RanGAP) involved in mRNA processing and transport